MPFAQNAQTMPFTSAWMEVAANAVLVKIANTAITNSFFMMIPY
jgi:hypothetical protein